jgi:hypothetical protein
MSSNGHDGPGRNHDRQQDTNAPVRELSIALETLANLFYLIEREIDHPERVRVYLSLTERPLSVLKSVLDSFSSRS